MKALYKEFRTAERYSLNLPGYLKINGDKREEKFKIVTENISAKGAYLTELKKEVKEGSKVKLEVYLTINKIDELYGLPKEVKFHSEGIVSRSSNIGTAIRFQGKGNLRHFINN